MPVAGSASSSRKTARPVRAQSRTRSAGPQVTGPHTAPAATEVVAPGGLAVRTLTRRPDSARVMAVVRPITPAPRTSTSNSLGFVTVLTLLDPHRVDGDASAGLPCPASQRGVARDGPG